MKRVLPLLSLVLLATLPFLGGVRGGFIEDDLGVIRDRPELRAGGDLGSVFADNYWGGIWCGLYRPLTLFSYGLDRLVFGAEGEGGPPAPFGVHVTNLLLNAGCAVLLWRLLVALYGARRGGAAGAWLGAAIFAAHPAHVEAVVHMVGRADLLAALFFLAAWLAHGAPDAARGARPWIAASLYLASLLSKESGALLPALLLADAALRRPWRGLRELVRSRVAPLAPFALALLVFVAVRGVVLGAEVTPPRPFLLYAPGAYVAFPDPAPFEVALTMTHALGEYLLLLVLPLRLSADYSGFPHATAPTAPVVLAGAAVALLVAAAARAGRRGNREPLAWMLVFLWTFVPISNLVAGSGIVMAERALYLPSIALSGLVAAGATGLLERGRGRRAIPVLGGLAVLLLAARAALRAPVWRDARTLFEETVASGRHHGHLALTGLVDVRLNALLAQPERAGELLPGALALARESVAFHRTTVNTAQLAYVLERSGELEAALGEWARIADVDPRRAADVRRVAAALAARARAGELEGVRPALETASAALGRARAAADPARTALWTEAGTTLLEALVVASAARGDWLSAADGCGMLQTLAPHSAVLREHRVPALEGAVRALSSAGRAADARRLALELERVDPGNATAARALGR